MKSQGFFKDFGGMSHPNKSIVKSMREKKNKKYIQIVSFQRRFFFSNLHAYNSSGPEKEGVQVGGLGRVGVEIKPWFSSYSCSAVR